MVCAQAHEKIDSAQKEKIKLVIAHYDRKRACLLAADLTMKKNWKELMHEYISRAERHWRHPSWNKQASDEGIRLDMQERDIRKRLQTLKANSTKRAPIVDPYLAVNIRVSMSNNIAKPCTAITVNDTGS